MKKKKKKKQMDGADIEVLIEDVGYRGRGVARHEGRVVFVPGVIEGERVRIGIRHRHKRFADAELREVLEPSPNRVTPSCPLALRPKDEAGAPVFPCVGCSYQHMAYEEEVRMKQQQLQALLKRIGKLEALPVADPVGSPVELGYRNKIRLHGGTYQGKRVLGYVGANNRSVLDIPQCPIACDAINARLAELRGEGEATTKDTLRRPGYGGQAKNTKEGKVTTESTESTGGPENRARSCAAHSDSQDVAPGQKREKGWLESLRRSAEVTLRYTEVDGVQDALRGVKRMKGELTERSVLGDLAVPAGGFYQVNASVSDLLIAYVRDLLAASDCGHMLDLYCGVGVFGLAAALEGKAVWGIDCDEGAIQCAQQNAARLVPDGDLSFEVSSAERAVQEMLERSPLDDTVAVVDPPRTGLDKHVCEALASHAPRELIYVSCAPDKLARDLKTLVDAGYQIITVKLFDMFPRTACFETVVVMRRVLDE